MSGLNGPQDADVEQAASELSEGLRNCRTVVNSYRALLSSDNRDDAGEEGDPPFVLHDSGF